MPFTHATVHGPELDTAMRSVNDITATHDPHETIGFLTSFIASRGLADDVVDLMRRAGWDTDAATIREDS